jgi:hypothetical protein
MQTLVRIATGICAATLAVGLAGTASALTIGTAPFYEAFLDDGTAIPVTQMSNSTPTDAWLVVFKFHLHNSGELFFVHYSDGKTPDLSSTTNETGLDPTAAYSFQEARLDFTVASDLPQVRVLFKAEENYPTRRQIEVYDEVISLDADGTASVSVDLLNTPFPDSGYPLVTELLCAYDVPGPDCLVGRFIARFSAPLLADGSANHYEILEVALFATEVSPNSPPEAGVSGGGTFEVGADVNLVGEVVDVDGDQLWYEWRLQGSTGAPLDSGFITPDASGEYQNLDLTIASADLGLGQHVIELGVDDGVNPEFVAEVGVEVVDTTEPTLGCIASPTVLWPPNHRLVDVVIDTDVTDNSGGPVTLSVDVQSSEPPDALGDASTEPDIIIGDVGSENTFLQLRSERSGMGDGRIYTVTVTAADESLNVATCKVEIVAPHDKKKK